MCGSAQQVPRLMLSLSYGRGESTGQGIVVLGGLWPGGHTVTWVVVSGELRWEEVLHEAKTQDSGSRRDESLSRMDFRLPMIKG